jgi:hypothetical protein
MIALDVPTERRFTQSARTPWSAAYAGRGRGVPLPAISQPRLGGDARCGCEEWAGLTNDGQERRQSEAWSGPRAQRSAGTMSAGGERSVEAAEAEEAEEGPAVCGRRDA